MTTFIDLCKNGDKDEIIIQLQTNNKPERVELNNGFVAACSEGHLDIVNLILNDSSVQRQHLEIGFHRACLNNHVGIVHTLGHKFDFLQNQPDNFTLFARACSKGHIDILLILYDWDPSINVKKNDWYCFRQACSSGYIDIVKQLYDWDTSIDIGCCNNEPFRKAFKNGHMKIIQLLRHWKPEIDESAFVDICRFGDLDLAKDLLKNNPKIDVRAHNNSAFFYACRMGHISIIDFLLKTGIEQDVKKAMETAIYPEVRVYLNSLEKRCILDFPTVSLCEKDECPICKDKSVDLETPCKHSFCRDCIEGWLMHNNNCPYCRKKLKSKVIFDAVSFGSPLMP